MRRVIPLAALALWAALAGAAPAGAQPASPDTTIQAAPDPSPPAAAPDTAPGAAPGAESAPADTSAPVPVSARRAARAAVGADVDRFEFGGAIVEGPFDAIGTIAYHRFVRRGGPFENWVHVEVSGARTEFLKEGAVSASYLLAPLRLIHRDWRIRPILEGGPGGHLVVQVAEVEGFGETAFHARAYLKMHVLAGLETVIGDRWGLVVRGRLSAPAHRPLDYAQIALFFR
jgi:hypothetical protein